jgi:hypothetical protein
MTDNITFYYIIFAIVLLHVLLGFAWVIYKFMIKGKSNSDQMDQTDDKV